MDRQNVTCIPPAQTLALSATLAHPRNALSWASRVPRFCSQPAFDLFLTHPRLFSTSETYPRPAFDLTETCLLIIQPALGTTGIQRAAIDLQIRTGYIPSRVRC